MIRPTNTAEVPSGRVAPAGVSGAAHLTPAGGIASAGRGIFGGGRP